MSIIVLLIILWGFQKTASLDFVSIGGIFNALSEEAQEAHQQSQYLAAFLLAIDHINNKTDGIYDTILPNTSIDAIIRHVDSASLAAQAAVSFGDVTSKHGRTGVDAAISTIADMQQYDLLLSEIFSYSKTLHLPIRQLRPEVSRNIIAHYPYNINLLPSITYQAHVWQQVLCAYGFTTISLFYEDTSYGHGNVQLLMDGTFCTITATTSHLIAPDQRNFSTEIIEAHDALSVVHMLFLHIDTAVPFLEQAFAYGLNRPEHQYIFGDELLTIDIWRRLNESTDVVGALRGATGFIYSPEEALFHSVQGQSFQQRFRNRPSTLIDGVCDTSVDDSDSTHFLYRSEDGSLCAGLNHSSFVSASDFAPKVGLVYDGVIALALGLHELLHVEDKSSIDSLELRQAIQDNVSFTGVSGYVDLVKNDDGICGLIRISGFHYTGYGFNEIVYNSPNRNASWVYTGDWNGVDKIALPCVTSDPRCYSHIYNTPGGVFPTSFPRYVGTKLPAVLKVGALFNTFNEDGSVNAAGVQQLAAFLMAVREINNKTDGIADDLLPNTKIVVSVRSAHDMINILQQVENLANVDFGSGSDVIVNGLGVSETLGVYRAQSHLTKLVVNAGPSHHLLNNPQLFSSRIHLVSATSFYGTALQSLVCSTFGYRKLTIFLTNDQKYLDAYSEFLSGELCTFTILSLHVLASGQSSFEEEIKSAKQHGATIFVILADARVTHHLVRDGTHDGLFGANKQVFGHADSFAYYDDSNHDVELANHLNKVLYHGFIGVRESPNYSTRSSTSGHRFISRWRHQAATNGTIMNGNDKCNMQRDDNDLFHLYANPPNFDMRYKCSGLVYSTFAEDGSDLVDHVPHAYDAVMLAAYGFHNLLYELNTTACDADTLADILLNDVRFTGATGDVELFAGLSAKGGIGRGTRRVAQYFDVVNFVRASDNILPHETNATKTSEQYIGLWELTSGFEPCSKSTNAACKKPVFNTDNNEIVRQTPPGEVLNKDIVGLQVLAIVVAIVAVLSLIWYCANRHIDFVGKSYCGMFPVICLGTLILAARLYLSSVTPTNEICVARLVFLYDGLCAFWGPVVLSSVRAKFLTRDAQTKTRYTVAILQGAMASLLIVILLLCLLFSVGTHNYVLTQADTMEPNRNDSYATCEYQNRTTGSLLMILHVLLLLWGMRAAFLARDIKDKLQETKVAYYMLMLFVVTVFFLYPFYIMSEDRKLQMFTMVEYNMGAVFLLCFLIIIGQKVYLVYFGEEEDEVELTIRTLSRSSQAKNKRISMLTVLQSMSPEGRVMLCRQQLAQWMITLVKLDDLAAGVIFEQFKERGDIPRVVLSASGLPVVTWKALKYILRRNSSAERTQYVLEDIEEEKKKY